MVLQIISLLLYNFIVLFKVFFFNDSTQIGVWDNPHTNTAPQGQLNTTLTSFFAEYNIDFIY